MQSIFAEGVTMEAKAATPAAPSAELVVPGQQFEVAVDLRGPSGVKIRKASIVAPEGWNVTDLPVDEKSPLERRFTVHVSPTAQIHEAVFPS